MTRQPHNSKWRKAREEVEAFFKHFFVSMDLKKRNVAGFCHLPTVADGRYWTGPTIFTEMFNMLSNKLKKVARLKDGYGLLRIIAKVHIIGIYLGFERGFGVGLIQTYKQSLHLQTNLSHPFASVCSQRIRPSRMYPDLIGRREAS